MEIILINSLWDKTQRTGSNNLFNSVVSLPVLTCALGDKPVVFIEVQPEAEETQALVGAGHQQHQELLDDALKEAKGVVRRLWNTSCAQSRSWIGLLPGRSAWGCGAGSTSLVWFPGTPESSSSPLLPVHRSLPTDPETNRILSHI